jgi:hypothetical protein
MELEDIEALRASVEGLRRSHEQLVDEVQRRTDGAHRDRETGPSGPRHIDEVLAHEGQVAGTGFVIRGGLAE